MQAIDWQSRIVGRTKVDPAALIPNPENWRTHPKAQVDAMVAAMNEIGSIQPVIVNVETGHIIDGHLRVAVAVSYGVPMIDVLHVSLPLEMEKKALQSHDALAAMADIDSERLIALAKQLSWDTDELAMLFAPDLELAMADMDRQFMEPAIPPGAKQSKKFVYEPPTETVDVLSDDGDDIYVVNMPLTNAQRERLFAAIDIVRRDAPTHITTSAGVIELCTRYLQSRGVTYATGA